MAMEELLEMAKVENCGSYYGIWSSIADRAILRHENRFFIYENLAKEKKPMKTDSGLRS